MTDRRQFSGLLWTIVFCICAVSFAFMLYASLHEAAIADESAHIPAGYGYVHNLDYRLNPEHPPLVKALAAMPLLLLQPNFPTNNSAWTTEVNGQWLMGEQLLYRSGNNADDIVQVSRIMPMLLTLLLIIFIYFWSKKIMGGVWALLPTFLFALSPIVLAHGHYVTTDIGATFGILFSTYFFIKYLREPSAKHIVFAGLALGVAELAKFSVVLLIPYFIILAVVRFFMDAHQIHGRNLWRMMWRKLGQLLLVFLIAYLIVIYPAYALLTAHYPQAKQVSDSQSILTSFAGGPVAAGAHCALMRCIADADIRLAGHSLTRPLAQYLLGVLMILQRSVGGNTNYFLNEVSGSGSHIYFLVMYFFKESLPALIIVLTALLLALWGMGRAIAHKRAKSGFLAYLHEHFSEFALAVFLIIYWSYTLHSTLNIGIRHLMPIIPIMYILAAGTWRKWIKNMHFESVLSAAKSVALAWLKLAALCILLSWVFLETISAAPYFLSYFNEIGGGTWEGYHYVTDSNYDWGQDMLRLQDFVNAHPEIDKIGVDYFGTTGAPGYYLGAREVDWWSAKGNPADQGIHWLAISINTLEQAIQPTSPNFFRKPEDSYPWLTSLRPFPPGMGNVPPPDYRVGTSIFVYKL